MTDMHDTADLVSKALRRAWQLGQTYWQQADSEYQSHWKKADATQATFDQLVEDTRAAILTSNSGAQPAPSVPDGWIRAIDEALVVTHLGVANASDTYEQAKAKLESLLGFHVDVATDPAVNGGWKLVPRPPTPTMVKAGLESSHVLNVHRVLACYDAMIDAAPEAKR